MGKNCLVNWLPNQSCFMKSFLESEFSVARLECRYYSLLTDTCKLQSESEKWLKTFWSTNLMMMCISLPLIYSQHSELEVRGHIEKKEVPQGVCVKRWGTPDWGNLTLKSALQGLTGLSADWFHLHVIFKGLKSMCAQIKQSTKTWKIN